MAAADPFLGISAFVRAAEARSFTRAARLLGLTPSAVSKSVSRLEAELGARLFNRSPRQVTLTPEGEAFFERCQELVHSVEDARALVAGTSLHPRGGLKVFAPVSFVQALLAPALGSWLAAHPDLRLDLVVTDRHPNLVEERFDVGIRYGDIGDSSLVARPLPAYGFATLASEAYLQSRGIPRAPADLGAHNCLGYLLAATGLPRTWTFTRAGRTEYVEPAGSLRTDLGQVLIRLAEAGTGIIQVPHYFARESLAAGRLVRILEDYEVEGPPLWVVYPKSRQRSPKIQAFVAFALELGQFVEIDPGVAAG